MRVVAQLFEHESSRIALRFKGVSIVPMRQIANVVTFVDALESDGFVKLVAHGKAHVGPGGTKAFGGKVAFVVRCVIVAHTPVH